MDAVNEFLEKYLKSPDDLLEVILGWSAFPGIVLTLFLVYGFVTAWLDLAKNTAKTSMAVVRGATRVVDRLKRTPVGRLVLVFALSSLVVLLETAWSLAAVVMGNVLYYAYYVSPGSRTGDAENLFSLPPAEVLYRVDWLGYSHFSSIYLPVLLIILAFTVIKPGWTGNLGIWISSLPLVPLAVGTAVVAFVELVFGVVLQSKPISTYPELAWQGAFLGVAVVFVLASMAAFSAASELRSQWTVLLGDGSDQAVG